MSQSEFRSAKQLRAVGQAVRALSALEREITVEAERCGGDLTDSARVLLPLVSPLRSLLALLRRCRPYAEHEKRVTAVTSDERSSEVSR